MPNLAALRAAIFLLSAKNRWGAHMCPPAVRGLKGLSGFRNCEQFTCFTTYLLDLRELANSNDMHKSLVGDLF